MRVKKVLFLPFQLKAILVVEIENGSVAFIPFFNRYTVAVAGKSIRGIDF